MIKNEIIELLEDNELRKEVLKSVQSVWRRIAELYDNPDEDMAQYLEKNKQANSWEEARDRADIQDESYKINKAFDKYVVQKITKPCILTLKELTEAFFCLATPTERHLYEFEESSPDDCSNLYMVFVNYIANQILSHRYSDPFPICRVTYKEEDELLLQGFLLGYQHAKGEKWQPPDLREDETIWSKNGINVSLLRGADVIRETPGGKKLCHMLAVIEGEMSTSTCSVLQNEMSRILPTAVRSADLLQAEGFGGKYKVVCTDPLLVFEREIDGLPWIEDKLIKSGRTLIRQYLDAYYSDSYRKKDSMNRRIRNAVCLLTESDNQPNNAVGLALSITGIEALLDEKVDGITKILAERIGALLEPDRSQRNNTIKFVKDLYNDRSDALHGRSVEKETEARTRARQLAAAVLSGVISRRNFLHRAGYDPETPQKLLQDLDKSFASGEATGVEEYNVRNLWRK